MKPAPTQVAAIRAAAALRAATRVVAASAEPPEQAVAVAPLEASAKPGAPAMDDGRAGLHRVPARPQPRDDAFVTSPRCTVSVGRVGNGVDRRDRRPLWIFLVREARRTRNLSSQLLVHSRRSGGLSVIVRVFGSIGRRRDGQRARLVFRINKVEHHAERFGGGVPKAAHPPLIDATQLHTRH